MSHTQLQFRTFDELLNEASSDLHMYDVEGMIEPSQLIKIAQAVNFRLGLKLNQTQEIVLDMEHHKARLPADFYVLNFALLILGSRRIQFQGHYGGDHREDVAAETTLAEVCAEDMNIYSCKGTFINCDKEFVIVETKKMQTYVHDDTRAICVHPGKLVSNDCLNRMVHGEMKIEFRDGFVHSNFECGKLYLNYQGKMEDQQGNLLVLDHPMVNEYYEYAFKERILENLYMNGEEVTRKLELVRLKLRDAKSEAMSYCNTPDYADFKKVFDMNRKAMYHKYYYMFAS